MKRRPKTGQSATERVLAAVESNPDQSYTQIAAQADTSRQRVHQILQKLGYRKVWVKSA
jgi:DNA-binding IclR family transcriptional regulator